MSVEEVLEPNWTELLFEVDMTEPKEMVVKEAPDAPVQQQQFHQEKKVPTTHGVLPSDANQISAASQRATPKGVLTLMKVEGLTIYHVKSHLQKYRTAQYKPETSEGGSSEKKMSKIDEMKSLDFKTSMGITEALRLQIEVQKKLHEQLEARFHIMRLALSDHPKSPFRESCSDDTSPNSIQITPGNEKTEAPDKQDRPVSPNASGKRKETSIVKEEGSSSPKRVRGEA
ncbi:hypothetical protein SAY86_022167 [Trapa natans]|uniref:MYB-CC type transcription factor LHEQLE-containing domain-containing protein n=1 Tax=Trapa natans TaxID=22666 RepID=A0AAN7RG51_TRANT|nr:hypothetical protein SAY86_022167 [Trapa natans]